MGFSTASLCVSSDMKKAHRSEFLKTVKERFPEVRDGINKEDGLLSFEVAVFIKFIQRKIDSNDNLIVIFIWISPDIFNFNS